MARLSPVTHRGAPVMLYRLEAPTGEVYHLTEAVLKNKLAFVTLYVTKASRKRRPAGAPE
jgi:hypothetical protein